ncbi:pseudouridylate synthase RPUSD4, mitochondrial [Bombina bombina]|uniref:pseudouridylate synthase RPUSD4, mitochondrial n=1 Tax=Bombina bombina TaxID=8345 RepID=UPI00235AAAFC|nr:pseudouridylate synthase RPUSD4, mitochondrial [Bombina bombina]
MAASGISRAARVLAEKIRSEKTFPRKERTDREKNPPLHVSLRGLKSRIVKEKSDLVLINKPTGLSVHGGPDVQYSVASLLPALAQKLFGRGAEPLRLCHRLDRNTSGALILARSEEAAHHVQELLREHKAQRVYWALCLGVPSPLEGIVDIPIIERVTPGPQKHYKMTLCPRFRASSDGALQRMHVSHSAREAVTQYRVIGESTGASLLELRPITGVKHQLRVHLSLALHCPILGDHKYSHWGRLAPQKPPPSVLHALGLKLPKARSLSLHLHAAQITLPASPGHSPIVLQCPLPHYFLNSLRDLHIPLPDLQNLAPSEE